MKLKRLHVVETVRALGLICRYDSANAEWRIDYRSTDPRWSEDSAYFTTWPDDAIETARAMSALRGADSGFDEYAITAATVAILDAARDALRAEFLERLRADDNALLAIVTVQDATAHIYRTAIALSKERAQS